MAGTGDGWLERQEAGARFVCDPEFEPALRALGLPDAGVVARLLASAPAGGTGRAASAVVSLPGRAERLHLRPVRHGGALARLWAGRVLGLARPLAELRVTAILRARGAPVPRPLCALGWRAAPLWRAAFGSLQVEDARDGLQWLAGPVEASAVGAAAAAAGRAVRRFHAAGGRHPDLHVGNLLVGGPPDAPEVLVIDLDKAQVGSPPDARRRLRELARLYRSLHKRGLLEQVDERARAAFLEAYLAGDAALGRALAAHWPRERRRVARHALAHRLRMRNHSGHAPEPGSRSSKRPEAARSEPTGERRRTD